MYILQPVGNFQSYALHESSDVLHKYMTSPVRDYHVLWMGVWMDRRTASKYTYLHLHKMPASDVQY